MNRLNRRTMLMRTAAAVAAGTLAIETLDARVANAADEIEPGFVALFDGESLAGWEGNLKMFRVERGAIIAGTLEKPIPNNEFLCSKKSYGDFELRLDAKLVGQGDNAGVQFRSQRIPNHHEVIGYQCDIGLMQGKPIWGWLYDESRRKKFLAEAADQAALSKALKTGDWNSLVVRCEGPRIQIWVNAVLTVDYVERDGEIAREGLLGLQIHGGAPAEASYRRIRIRELPKG